MLKLPSDPRNIELVESFVQKVAEKYRLSPDQFGNLRLSVTEAVNNAMIHGNGQDESKNVCIELHKRKDAIAVRISDEGRGFDYNNVPDPTLPENVCKCGGRGVFLMRNCSDRIDFRNNGSTVEMQFKLW
ncbi:MAG: ATP-binding protein [Saprospiraceae bacterium]|nr:ATP-binding protein [Saprospiraceae bacterium]